MGMLIAHPPSLHPLDETLSKQLVQTGQVGSLE